MPRRRHLVKRGGDISVQSEPHVRLIDLDAAFEKGIQTIMIKNLKHLDAPGFFAEAEAPFVTRIKSLINPGESLKVYTILTATYAIVKDSQVIEELKHFNTKAHTIHHTTDIRNVFMNEFAASILRDMDEFEERDSGWTLRAVEFLTIHVNRYNPMRVGSYIPLPKQILNKKACINVQNDDNKCFKWAVLSALVAYANINVHHSDRVSEYKKYEKRFKLDFTGIDFPVSPCQIPKFEIQNNISINVYVLKFERRKFRVLPLQITMRKRDPHVNLLLIEESYPYDEEDEEEMPEILAEFQRSVVSKHKRQKLLTKEPQFHYVWIKSLNRLLSSQLTIKNRVFICESCLHYFYEEAKFKKHVEDCTKVNKNCSVKVPEEENKFLQFKQFSNKEMVPFVVYGDFESVLKPVEEDGKIQEHEALSVGYYLKCSYDDSLSYYRSYRGEEPGAWFVNQLKDIAMRVAEIYKRIIPMKPLTPEERQTYINATICHICGEGEFRENDAALRKVADHSHLTGIHPLFYISIIIQCLIIFYEFQGNFALLRMRIAI